MSYLRIIAVITFAVAAVLAAAPAFAFGALAVDANQGSRHGFSFDQRTTEAARVLAAGQCGGGCKVVVTFNRTCAAYAADQTPGSTVYGWAYAPNQTQAQNMALGYCRQHQGTACQLRVWACDGNRGADGVARFEGEAPARPQVAVAPVPERQTVRPPPAPSPQPVTPAIVAVPPAAPLAADATRRIALVVGNDRYEHLDPLQKAVNDARAVGDALARLGFDVVRVENSTRRLLNQKLVEFTNRVTRGDTAFFFYAGHGVEVRGTNYLLPVDTPAAREGEEGIVTGEGIAADSIIERLQERGARVSMVVLDACRENPFRKPGTRGVGATRGLGQMTTPEGVFVLYSAGVGQTALDRLSERDPNPNSVFTRTFVQLLGKAGMSVQELAKTTQSEVRRLAATINHPQMPAYYDQILGQFTLVPAR
jgi:hypothetical protein